MAPTRAIERWTLKPRMDVWAEGDGEFSYYQRGNLADGPLVEGEVEVVRADAYRGAVDALREIAKHRAGFEPSWCAVTAQRALEAMGLDPFPVPGGGS